MGYFIQDAEGEWVVDLASNSGIFAMYRDENLPTSVKEFLKDGTADLALIKEMIEDLKDAPEEYQFILEALEDIKEYQMPIIVTDGVS